MSGNCECLKGIQRGKHFLHSLCLLWNKWRIESYVWKGLKIKVCIRWIRGLALEAIISLSWISYSILGPHPLPVRLEKSAKRALRHAKIKLRIPANKSSYQTSYHWTKCRVLYKNHGGSYANLTSLNELWDSIPKVKRCPMSNFYRFCCRGRACKLATRPDLPVRKKGKSEFRLVGVFTL